MKNFAKSPLNTLLMVATLALLQGCSSLPKNSFQAGLASWYGQKYHGRKTASGKIFNMNAMTAAHKTLRFGTIVTVVDPSSGKSVRVTINDRGPFTGNRIIDLSKAAAKKLGILKKGTAKVVLYLQ